MDWLDSVKKRFRSWSEENEEAIKRLLEERDKKQATEQEVKDAAWRPDALVEDFKELFLDSLKANKGLRYIDGLLDMIEAGAFIGVWREHLLAWTRTEMHQHQRDITGGEITRLRLDSEAEPHESAARIRGLGQAQDGAQDGVQGVQGGFHYANLAKQAQLYVKGAAIQNHLLSPGGIGVSAGGIDVSAVHTQTANAVSFVPYDRL